MPFNTYISMGVDGQWTLLILQYERLQVEVTEKYLKVQIKEKHEKKSYSALYLFNSMLEISALKR